MSQDQTLAAAIVRQLSAWGVRFLFGVTGDDILPLLDAVAREGSIRYIGAAHEAGAAFMASAWARLTGEMGVCAASAAGSVNLLQGLADAYMDGLPVLALTGQSDAAQMGTPAKQYYHQQVLYSTFGGYCETVVEASAGVRLLIRAMSRALLKRTVSHLSVPRDRWIQQVNASPGSLPALVATGPRRGCLLGDGERVAGLVRAAHRPLIIAGADARRAAVEIQRLAETWGAAVVVAQGAKGVLSDDSAHVVGGIGEGWTPELIGECDCVLLIGSATFETPYLPKVPVIQLRADPWQINDLYLWDSLAGDLPAALDFLLQHLDHSQVENSWMLRIEAVRRQRAKMADEDRGLDVKPIHPARLMAELGRAVRNDAVLALDEGAFNHWFDRSFMAAGQTILLSSRWRSMGAGVPAAIAAGLRFPERQILAVTGDGGLLMSLGELATVARYALPIVIVAVCNRVYGLEVDKSVQSGLALEGTTIGAPDFSECARSMGLRGYRVEDPGLLRQTFNDALSGCGPALVEVVCSDVRLPEMMQM